MTFEDLQDNPFNSSPNPSPETPPPDEVIRQAIRTAMLAMRVHLPGKITKVLGNQRVNVQPGIKTRLMDGTIKDLPELQNVMVQMPVGGGYSIKLPIKVGDKGSIMFSDRSLAIWSNADGESVDPQDSRTHDINDAVFVPGLVPNSLQTKDSTDDLVITVEDGQIRITPKGGFRIQNPKAELIEQLTLLTQTLSTASTIVGGPFTPDVVEILTQISEKLKTLQG